MAQKHVPSTFDPVWTALVPNESKKVVATTELKELELLQKLHFFGGSGKMKSVDWEPDALGSLRVFTAGKIRMQLFRASDVRPTPSSKQTDYQTGTKNELIKLLNQARMAKQVLPKSIKACVDCGSGPVVVGIPPGFLVVQEACDSAISSGVRRSFTPKGMSEDFKLAVSPSFALKDKLLAAASNA